MGCCHTQFFIKTDSIFVCTSIHDDIVLSTSQFMQLLHKGFPDALTYMCPGNT